MWSKWSVFTYGAVSMVPEQKGEKPRESLDISIEIRLYFQATWIHAKASFNFKYKYKRGEIKNESSGDRYKDIYMALDIEMGEGQGDLLC